MAGNTTTITDPLDGQFDDWFELHNSSTDSVDLSDFTLTDNLDNPTKWSIPTGTVIPPADSSSSGPTNNRIRTATTISSTPTSNSASTAKPSPSSPPTASSSIVSCSVPKPTISAKAAGPIPPLRAFHVQPTPGAPNLVDNPSNLPPTLNPIPDAAVNEGALLSFTATATDPDPGQTLTFSLEPGAPTGCAINPDSGVFTWIPTEAQGPGAYSITIASPTTANPTSATPDPSPSPSTK
jgi:hypothetical protein